MSLYVIIKKKELINEYQYQLDSFEQCLLAKCPFCIQTKHVMKQHTDQLAFDEFIHPIFASNFIFVLTNGSY